VTPHPAVRERTSAWHRAVCRFCSTLYFSHVRIIHLERLPAKGPVLYLGLHRNGAVDGFVYGAALGGPVFLISTQLRRSLFARLFFAGIAVARRSDEGDQRANQAALDECRALLRAGGRLFVFPEGTSSLGPRHLPLKSGAAHLILDYLALPAAPPLNIVPLGIHYEQATSFRSGVEILVGNAVSLSVPDDLSPLARVRAVQRTLTAALEGVGVNVATPDEQECLERAARMAALTLRQSYALALKKLERERAAEVAEAWTDVDGALRGGCPLRYHGLPLVSVGRPFATAVALIGALAVVLPGLILNFPPLVAGWLAGWRLADDRNVVTLWRLLAGVPVLALWATAVVALGVGSGHPSAILVYAALSLSALGAYDRAQRLLCRAYNDFRFAALRQPFVAWRDAIERALAGSR
jgi:1-acyl-sn-glycerol-3-phosphate acyltransferase